MKNMLFTELIEKLRDYWGKEVIFSNPVYKGHFVKKRDGQIVYYNHDNYPAAPSIYFSDFDLDNWYIIE